MNKYSTNSFQVVLEWRVESVWADMHCSSLSQEDMSVELVGEMDVSRLALVCRVTYAFK